MSKKINRKNVNPGELLLIGNQKLDEVKMQLYQYNSEEFSSQKLFQI